MSDESSISLTTPELAACDHNGPEYLCESFFSGHTLNLPEL